MAKYDITKVGQETRFKKGQSGNLNGRPKGKSRKSKLSIIVKELANAGIKSISDVEKTLIYQMFDIVMSDYVCNSSVPTVQHLYFMESDFGVKIGVSKNANTRLKQIQGYAPSSKLLKVIPFAGAFEKKLHTKFKKQNIKNNPAYGVEWFYKNDDLMNFIDSIDCVQDLVNVFGGKRAGQMKLPF
jgi:hypothetical protein